MWGTVRNCRKKFSIFYHHRVARQSVSIAVSTSWRHFERSCARIHAVFMCWDQCYGAEDRARLYRAMSALVDLPASPIRWRTIDGCSKDARVVLWWVGSRKMSEQVKSSLCDNWGYWGLTCSTPHFFVGDMRCIWNMCYTAHIWLNESRRRLEATVILHVSAP